MKKITSYQVYPQIPESLAFLETLSRNLWWCWTPDAIELFRRIDPHLWSKAKHNPLAFLTYIEQDRLNALAEDRSFVSNLNKVKSEFQERVITCKDPQKTPFGKEGCIAYFSMEFGIHESLPIFAGGLGVLAGDHLKAASVNDIPLIGLGLMYRYGYFRQYLNQDGWQQEDYPQTNLFHLPMEKVKGNDGQDLIISIPAPNHPIRFQTWKLQVGRVTLLLMDTYISDNTDEIKEITNRLYAAEHNTRLTQEIVLGIGGMKLLDAMGINPSVVHLNEGHCAFVNLERISQVMQKEQVDLKTAMEIVPRTTVFTTHTPVPAGHDKFSPELLAPYFKVYSELFGLPVEQIIRWGQEKDEQQHEPFCMSLFALRMAQHCNGVSELHGQVARHMWTHIWPSRADEEVPIGHVTNGIHVSSVLSPELVMLFERHLGPQWYLASQLKENMARVDDIFEEDLWRAHELSRSRLIRSVREHMSRQYGRRNASRRVMRAVESVLDQDALTIGFSRRYATYKRGNLIFRDPERLNAIVNNKDHPVQFVFAGKAHPKDHEGKEVIRQLIHYAEQERFRHKIVFLEDYDMHTARLMVQGCDIWLNNPRRPMEACGTSGMKAAVNGVLNLSILDGWWCEGFTDDRGWRIGNGEEYHDPDYQDAVESQALYNVLENDVVPCYYDRKPGGIPNQWVYKMRESIKMAMADFCNLRMVREYTERFYIPAHQRMQTLRENQWAEAKQLAVQHQRYLQHWQHIHIEPPTCSSRGPFKVNDTFNVTTVVHLGQLTPDEVEVQLYYGLLHGADDLCEGHETPMIVAEDRGDGAYIYRCDIICDGSGQYGFTVRAVPQYDEWLRFQPHLLTWVN